MNIKTFGEVIMKCIGNFLIENYMLTHQVQESIISSIFKRLCLANKGFIWLIYSDYLKIFEQPIFAIL